MRVRGPIPEGLYRSVLPVASRMLAWVCVISCKYCKPLTRLQTYFCWYPFNYNPKPCLAASSEKEVFCPVLEMVCWKSV